MNKEQVEIIKSKLATLKNNRNKEEIKELEVAIKNLDISEQLKLHGNLNFEELEIIFSIKHQLSISRNILEHLIWQYFILHMELNGYNAKELQLILETYKLTEFVAMESLIIDILEKETIADDEIQMIRDIISDVAMEKAIVKYEIKRKIEHNGIISISDFEKMKSFELYKLILQIIRMNRNNYELKDVFQEPVKGEKNYKIKMEIYKLLNNKST